MWSRLKTLDLWLIVIPLLLVGIGIAVIYSITITNPESDLAARQGWFLLVGLLAVIFGVMRREIPNVSLSTLRLRLRRRSSLTVSK